jgi:hypothetical protein
MRAWFGCVLSCWVALVDTRTAPKSDLSRVRFELPSRDPVWRGDYVQRVNEVKSDFSGLGLRFDDMEEYFGDFFN